MALDLSVCDGCSHDRLVESEIRGTSPLRGEATWHRPSESRQQHNKGTYAEVSPPSTSRVSFLTATNRPTVEARRMLISTAQRQAEVWRGHVRKQQQMSVKKGAYAKHSKELDEVRRSFLSLALADCVLSVVQGTY